MNGYSALTHRLGQVLLSGLQSNYTGLLVERKQFKPDQMPEAFNRYAIVISPPPRPWDERRLAVREVQYTFRVDLLLFVANFDGEKALFGTDTGERGLFEFINDVKDLLRVNDLRLPGEVNGFLDKTYDEPGGDPRMEGGGGVEFQELATTGYDSGSYSTVYRAKIPFLGRVAPFCHGKV